MQLTAVPAVGSPKSASFFIGLGGDPDGTAFLAALRGAVTEAKTA
ncbi:hypothetical protein [Actinomadura latina]|nr:hypothetical protein [Actinomadura latina]